MILRFAKLSLLVVVFFSCKKDKLKDEKEILIGKWSWVYTIYEYDKCQQNGGYSEVLNPASENVTYQMEFFEKGKVKFYEDNIEKFEFRIVFDYFKPSDNGPFSDPIFHFIIHRDNSNEQIFAGIVSNDSLFTYDEPFESIDSPCSDYKNFWGK
ncbi:MAG: hypothetical protein IPM77_02095 [Crocinitomicaceae bacterium]|nr:hypothetical protein [Crocinitomicaceae bacterium]